MNLKMAEDVEEEAVQEAGQEADQKAHDKDLNNPSVFDRAIQEIH